jgi:hypothetical protein
MPVDKRGIPKVRDFTQISTNRNDSYPGNPVLNKKLWIDIEKLKVYRILPLEV